MAYIFPLAAFTSSLGSNGKNVLPDRTNGKIYSFGTNSGSFFLVNDYSTGASVSVTAITSVLVSSGNNNPYDHSSCLGTDGFVYCTTDLSSNTSTTRLSKINPATHLETTSAVPVLFATPAHFSDGRDFQLIPFKIGSVNFVAILQANSGAVTNFEIFNVDTMSSVTTGAYSTTFDVPLFIKGAQSGTTQTFYNINFKDSTSIVLQKITYDTIGGLAFTTVKTYVEPDFDGGWSFVSGCSTAMYDASDDTVIFIASAYESGGYFQGIAKASAYLVKARPSDGVLLWMIPVVDQDDPAYQPICAKNDLSSGRLVYVPLATKFTATLPPCLAAVNQAVYLDINTSSGAYTTNINNYFSRKDNRPNYWSNTDSKIIFYNEPTSPLADNPTAFTIFLPDAATNPASTWAQTTIPTLLINPVPVLFDGAPDTAPATTTPPWYDSNADLVYNLELSNNFTVAHVLKGSRTTGVWAVNATFTNYFTYTDTLGGSNGVFGSWSGSNLFCVIGNMGVGTYPNLAALKFVRLSKTTCVEVDVASFTISVANEPFVGALQGASQNGDWAFGSYLDTSRGGPAIPVIVIHHYPSNTFATVEPAGVSPPVFTAAVFDASGSLWIGDHAGSLFQYTFSGTATPTLSATYTPGTATPIKALQLYQPTGHIFIYYDPLTPTQFAQFTGHNLLEWNGSSVVNSRRRWTNGAPENTNGDYNSAMGWTSNKYFAEAFCKGAVPNARPIIHNVIDITTGSNVQYDLARLLPVSSWVATSFTAWPYFFGDNTTLYLSIQTAGFHSPFAIVSFAGIYDVIPSFARSPQQPDEIYAYVYPSAQATTFTASTAIVAVTTATGAVRGSAILDQSFGGVPAPSVGNSNILILAPEARSLFYWHRNLTGHAWGDGIWIQRVNPDTLALVSRSQTPNENSAPAPWPTGGGTYAAQVYVLVSSGDGRYVYGALYGMTGASSKPYVLWDTVGGTTKYDFQANISSWPAVFLFNQEVVVFDSSHNLWSSATLISNSHPYLIKMSCSPGPVLAVTNTYDLNSVVRNIYAIQYDPGSNEIIVTGADVATGLQLVTVRVNASTGAIGTPSALTIEIIPALNSDGYFGCWVNGPKWVNNSSVGRSPPNFTSSLTCLPIIDSSAGSYAQGPLEPLFGLLNYASFIGGSNSGNVFLDDHSGKIIALGSLIMYSPVSPAVAGAGESKFQFQGFASVAAPITHIALAARSQIIFHGLFGPLENPPAPGTTPDFDWRITVISQYSNSPILLRLLEDFFQYVDPTTDLDAFYNLLWNVDTAVGYGLDVWGRIVGVSRILELASPGPFFGFEEAGDAVPFGFGPFWSGTGSSSSFRLADDAYRILIFAKALANISDGSVKSINQLLINLFGSGPSVGGNAYVEDNHDMTMVYKFTFSPTPVQLAIIEQSGVLPKPTGVSVTVDVP